MADDDDIGCIVQLNYGGIEELTDEQIHSEDFRHATCLYMKCNLLKTLPTSFSQMTQLQELYLEMNQLVTLPDEIGALSALTVLNVAGNKLTKLPSSIGRLGSLMKLQVSNNRLEELPAELGNLRQLQTLEASLNCLTTIPEELSNCCQVAQLAFDKNQLSMIPRQLCRLENLKSISLCGNQLLYLPLDLVRLGHHTFIYVDENPNLTSAPWPRRLTCNIVTHSPSRGQTYVHFPVELRYLCSKSHNCVPALQELSLRELSYLRWQRYSDSIPKLFRDHLNDPTGRCILCRRSVYISCYPVVARSHASSPFHKFDFYMAVCCSKHCWDKITYEEGRGLLTIQYIENNTVYVQRYSEAV